MNAVVGAIRMEKDRESEERELPHDIRSDQGGSVSIPATHDSANRLGGVIP